MGQPEGVVLRHLEHLRVRNMRPHTVYARRQVLWRLQCWAKTEILYLTDEQMAAWQVDRSRQVSATTVRMEMSGAREFYRWAVREGYRLNDPTIRLDMPRVIRRRPRPISDAALALAMETADPPLRVILGLAGFAGLRACEISRLDWAELDMVNGIITISDGKGGKSRIVPMSTVLTGLLADLAVTRRGAVIRRIDGRGGHVAPHRISQRANRYLHALGIPETLHQLRHRFATSMYSACLDIRAVQDVMGHASPETTAIYAAVASGVAVRAVERASHLAA